MAEDKKSCYCGGVLAIVIAVLTILSMTGRVEGKWVNIVVLIAAILIVVGGLVSGCVCTKLCKTKSQPEQPQQ